MIQFRRAPDEAGSKRGRMLRKENRAQLTGGYDEQSRLSYSRLSTYRLGSKIRRFICLWKGDFPGKAVAADRQRLRLHHDG
jgi:hypothetical protein